MEFEKRKALALAAMSSSEPDKSPKGTLDAPIIPLLNAINQHPSYFTTSSCSGRISILRQLQTPQLQKMRKKKAGDWIFITHDLADPETVIKLLFHESPPKQEGLLVFRFEPFIVAVDCLDISSAQSLVSTAISSGFRESGITTIQKRIVIAIRCSIRLEVPLGEMDQIMVSPDYVRYLVGLANEKMEANKKRVDGFLQAFLSKCPSVSTEVKIDSRHRQQALSEEAEGSLLDPIGKQLNLLPKVVAPEKNSLNCTKMLQLQFKHNIYDACRNDFRTESAENSSNDKEIGDRKLERAFDSDLHLGKSSACRCCLSITKIRILGQPVEKLFLWGQTASLLDSTVSKQILVFGGFGGFGRHARTNDSLMLDPISGVLKIVNAEGPPSPRVGHTSSVVGERVYIIGGRGDPMQILNDVWVLHAIEDRWQQLLCAGSLFYPRHRHASAVVGSKVYVFGGLNDGTIYASMHILETENLVWSEVSIQGEWPCPRHSHSLVAIGSQLFMFGGYDGEKALGDLYSFNVCTCMWKKETTSGKTPAARFSHSMFVYENYLGIVGGCPIVQNSQEVALLDLQSHVWRHVTINSVGNALLVRSTVSVVEDDLIIVGGGASCYAFGTMFNEPAKIDLGPFKFPELAKSTSILGAPVLAIDRRAHQLDNHMETTLGLNCGIDISTERDAHLMGAKHWVLQLERKYAKLGKDILKKYGWLDVERKVYSSQDGLHIFFPITAKFYAFLQEKALDFKGALNGSSQPVNPLTGKGFSSNEASLPAVLDLLSTFGGTLLYDSIESVRKAPKSPQKIMREAVHSLIKRNGISLELLEQLPNRWERLGDMVVLPVTAFKDAIWDSIGEELWPIVARSLGAPRLARQGRIASTGTRDSNLEVLVGDNGWVHHLENGILYSFDATKCMFSSGNLSEKLRMAELDCKDEVIVDLFAGIGYFVLPFLVKAGAKLVYACEWNPHALEALRHNVKANFMADRCVILEGDNRDVAPKGVADRVCLGLLPSSESSWLTAVRALRFEGGILHVHGNINDSGEDSWSEYVTKTINDIATLEGRCWNVSIQHMERVKWYAPHIRHLVADVRCKMS